MDYAEVPSLSIRFFPYGLHIPYWGRITCSPGESYPTHSHQHYEIHYLVEGEARVRIGKKEYTLKAHDVCCLRPDEVHTIHYITKTTLYYITVSITKWMIKEQIDWFDMTEKSNQVVEELFYSFEHLSVVSMGPHSAFYRLIKEFDQFSYEKSKQYSTLFRQCFVEWYETILKHRKIIFHRNTAEIVEDLPSNVSIQKVLDFIRTNSHTPLTLSQLCRESSLSPRHLQRLFKDIVHCTISDYIKEVRLQKAIQLLRDTNDKVETILSESGFRSRGAFFKWFTERTGQSPEQFRNNMKSFATENSR